MVAKQGLPHSRDEGTKIQILYESYGFHQVAEPGLEPGICLFLACDFSHRITLFNIKHVGDFIAP